MTVCKCNTCAWFCGSKNMMIYKICCIVPSLLCKITYFPAFPPSTVPCNGRRVVQHSTPTTIKGKTILFLIIGSCCSWTRWIITLRFRDWNGPKVTIIDWVLLYFPSLQGGPVLVHWPTEACDQLLRHSGSRFLQTPANIRHYHFYRTTFSNTCITHV